MGLEDELLELLNLHAALLDLDLEVDVLLEGVVNLVWRELGEAFFEEMDLEFDVEVLLLEAVYVLQRL